MTQRQIQELAQEIGARVRASGTASPEKAPADSADPSCACGTAERPTNETAQSGSYPLETAWSPPKGNWSPPERNIAALIDHTQLRPDATEDEISRLCHEARDFGFRTVCVHPSRVAQAVQQLRGTRVQVATVIGFPHGATLTPVKLAEAEEVLKLGAREIDMVMNIGALKSGDFDFVHAEIGLVVKAARQVDAKVKVILETGLLTEVEKMNASVIVRLAGADFVKTSTGFGPSGADPGDVKLLRQIVGDKMGVKAAGGIRTLERLREMVGAGASRIGSSSSVSIMKQAGGA